jgi:hypothetical protein
MFQCSRANLARLINEGVRQPLSSWDFQHGLADEKGDSTKNVEHWAQESWRYERVCLKPVSRRAGRFTWLLTANPWGTF